MAAGAQTLKRTPLYDRHVAAGARLVPFAGWEMPVQYGGIREEHVATRRACGLFDVSHMGQIETSGPQAEAFLQRVLSNDVAKIAPGGPGSCATPQPGCPEREGAIRGLCASPSPGRARGCAGSREGCEQRE